MKYGGGIGWFGRVWVNDFGFEHGAIWLVTGF